MPLSISPSVFLSFFLFSWLWLRSTNGCRVCSPMGR